MDKSESKDIRFSYIGENAHWDIYAPPGKSLHKKKFQIFLLYFFILDVYCYK